MGPAGCDKNRTVGFLYKARKLHRRVVGRGGYAYSDDKGPEGQHFPLKFRRAKLLYTVIQYRDFGAVPLQEGGYVAESQRLSYSGGPF